MSKEIIATDGAPPALGPYSQAIKSGNLVFTAGQVGLDPATGKLVPGDVSAQAERALQNLGAVLEAAGSSLQNVVKATVFMQNMGDYAAVNAVYARYLGAQPPARSAVAVAGLPAGALVEIEVIAVCE